MRLLYSLRDQDWQLTKSLGILKSSLEVLEGLVRHPEVNQIDVLANASIAGELPPPSAKLRIHLADRCAPRRWARLWWDQWGIGQWARRLAPDWLMLPKGFAPWRRAPTRITAYVHDDIFSHYRQRGVNPFPPGELRYFSRTLDRTVAEVDVVVTPSAFTAQELIRNRRCRRTPVPIGAPIVASCDRTLPDAQVNRVLLLASVFPHKLTARALEWLTRFARESRPAIMVTVIGRLPAGATWPDLHGWTHYERLPEQAYRNVRAACGTLAYFSEYEGFGRPPLEALCDGLRVVASSLPSHREHLPDSLLFENENYDNFAAVLRHVLTGPVPVIQTDTADEVAARWLAQLRLAQ